MTAYRFLEPLDVLILRGNKLFGDSGSYGESLIPPWPSVAAGAIRSQMLAEEGVDFTDFADGKIPHPTLGTPAQPGRFSVAAFHLARRVNGGVETLHPLPTDVVASRADNALYLQRQQPGAPGEGITGSFPMPQWPLLASDRRSKPVFGVWLTQAGWQRYLNGELPQAEELIESDQLWKIDTRVGVGLDPVRRSTDEGKLFSVQAVALSANHGFLAAVDGADPPVSGTLRLGGDGRAAAVSVAEYQPPQPDYAAIVAAGRCRIVLTSPGLFPQGWRLAGVDASGSFGFGGICARLISAAVPRAEIVSGWDLAHKCPKPAQRAVPTGSVYWLDELQSSTAQLRKLVETGLWPESGYDASRRAEGFNRFTFAAW